MGIYMLPSAGQLQTLLFLKRSPRLDRDCILAFRNRRLRRLIEHAYNNVPYYSRIFKGAGITPNDIRTEDDLKYIPVTSKRDMQDLPAEEIVSRGVKIESLITRKTSGSTGEASVIRRTWVEERILQGFRWRAMAYFGWRMRDRISNVGLPEQTQPSDSQVPVRVLQSLGLYRNKKINCLQSVDKILMELEAQHPDVIAGYPGVLSKLAKAIDSRGQIKNSPQFIAAGGETLIRVMRDHISHAFKAPVYNLYGSHEFNLIGWECRETGEMHTCDDNVLLEVQRDGTPVGEGERGELMGTSLHSFAMPFIRYRLGDVVTRGSDVCPCGLPFSTIGSVLGRMLDYFHLPGDRILHPYEITTSIKRQAQGLIRHHQIVQERTDRIVMKIVPFDKVEENVIISLEQSMKEKLGMDVEFRIMQVEGIDIEPNGKFRVSHSMLESDYDGIDWDKEFLIN